MKSKFSKYQSTFWKINYPTEWVVEKHPECVSFYAEDGFGALQFSAHLKDEKVTKADLDELINDEIPKETQINDIELEEFTGIAAEFQYENHFWRTWILRKNKLLLYVTYNCEFEDRQIEREIVNQIVNSLKSIN